MPGLAPGRRHERATIAALTGHHGPDHPTVVTASRQFAVDRLDDHIRDLVAKFPAITAAQGAQLHAAVVAITTGGGAE